MSSPQGQSSSTAMGNTTTTNGAAPASSSQSYMASGSGSGSTQSAPIGHFQQRSAGIGSWVPPQLNNSSQLDLQQKS
ncbi:unnamed protein product [Penicillium bialowiezense]